MRQHLTQKQKDLLDYIKTAVSEDAVAPSLRKAASALEISHAAVAQTMKTLEGKGYIKRDGRYSRTIHILDPMGELVGMQRQKSIPIIGHITAGLPMYAQQEWDSSIIVDSDMYPGQNLFALRIQGDSMKNAGILDKDLAICTPRQYAHNNEIVVALINNEEATVKRFFLLPDHIELRPENPEYSIQKYDFDQILIQGKISGIIRGPEGVE